jgi:hypothetical protein
MGAAAAGTDDSGGFRVEASQQLTTRALGDVGGGKWRLHAEYHRADPLTRPLADLSPRGRGGRDETPPACLLDGVKDQTDRPRPIRGEGWGEGLRR